MLLTVLEDAPRGTYQKRGSQVPQIGQLPATTSASYIIARHKRLQIYEMWRR